MARRHGQAPDFETFVSIKQVFITIRAKGSMKTSHQQASFLFLQGLRVRYATLRVSSGLFYCVITCWFLPQ